MNGAVAPSLDGSIAAKLPIGATTHHVPATYATFAWPDSILFPSSECAVLMGFLAWGYTPLTAVRP
ncbi:MAG: hypothetical protein LC114_00530 [Bryobacterales bacterium]|nr:hypothetical protein [Bryobacterales bacterium]MCZ2152380.1 hypothetical protein [Bryobacterales bacterium]MCZ2152381.1 hypothetical protein [Bryobacterales bacterium]